MTNYTLAFKGPPQKCHMSGLYSFHGTKKITESTEHRSIILPHAGPLQGEALVQMVNSNRVHYNPYTTKYSNPLI